MTIGTHHLIGLDLMGGDVEPQVIFDAAVSAASELSDCHFVLFASPEFAKEHASNEILQGSLSFEKATHVIGMNDRPVAAIKSKPHSSLVLGIKALKEKKIDAFISCGNTGALVGASSLYLPHLPNISRPSLLASFPAHHGTIEVLDVGGNVSAKAADLVQYAHFASHYRAIRQPSAKPKVALLNIGVESGKGTRELKEAYRLLKEMKNASFTFVGNVEGKDVFTSGIDVLVTSGFAGNIFLKTAEGIALFVLTSAQKKIQEKWVTAASKEALSIILQELKAELSYEASRGALVAGVDGIVIKCHGHSSKRALFNALCGARELIQTNLMEKLRTRLFLHSETAS